MAGKAMKVILVLFFFLFAVPVFSLPLSTRNRWIIDEQTGERVKLHCANWPSHIEVMLAEGLHKQPLQYIASELIAKHQFNCVRFTFAIQMWTRFANRTVTESLQSLNLTTALAGVAKHNPQLLNLTLPDAYVAVVDELGANGVMTIIDNHVSKPKWCCGDNDGNGFFGDRHFDPDEWLRGLEMAATRFRGKHHAIGIGMRNEPHGPYQNVDDWYKYFTHGANRVHKANPDLLVSISGLDYAQNLTFLRNRPLELDFSNKLVLESHWYPWGWGQDKGYVEIPLNQACPDFTDYFIYKTGFVNTGKNPVPVFLGEFGINQQNVSLDSDHFLSCFLDYATTQDIDWGIWALQGDYYHREGQTDMDETFGVMNHNWTHLRNPAIQRRLQLIKRKNQDPTSKSPSAFIMFHPQSGSCVQQHGEQEIRAADCDKFARWIHDADEAPIRLTGTGLCLSVVGDGLPPVLSTNCTSEQSSWKMLSDSKLQLGAKDKNGDYLCLHKENPGSPQDPVILTRKCICLDYDPDCQTNPSKDPTIQWFKLVLTNT